MALQTKSNPRKPSLELRSHLVFVYGTLKSGYFNHGLLHSSLTPSVPIGETAATEEKYPLFVHRILPYLINMPGVGYNVKGEVWKVGSTTLARLDRLESHPHFYRRQLITIVLDGDPTNTVQAWTYFLNAGGATLSPRQLSQAHLLSEYTHASLSR